MHKRLGEILIDAGVIEERQLKYALAEAARWGKRVGEVLISRNDCTEQDIIRALSTQLGIPVASLSTTVMIPHRVLHLIPAEFARERQVLPLFLSNHTGVLDVAVSDPASFELLDELRFRTGHTIRPLVAGPRELALAIRHFYFGEKRKVDASPGSPETAVRDESATTQHDGDARPERAVGTGQAGDTADDRPSPSDPLGDASADPSPVEHHIESEMTELRQAVASLQSQLHDVFAILREAAMAHQTLVAQLAERKLVDRAAYIRAVKARLKDRK